MRITRLAPLLAAVALVAAGCFNTYGVADRFVSGAVGGAADNAGKSYGNQMAASYSPMMGQMYAGLAFTMAFGSGGYAVGTVDYKAGEYTRWRIPNEKKEKESTLERARLFDDKDGNVWWKVKWVLDTAKPDESTMIMEALLDKQTSALLRLRSKMPNEKEGKEVPVTEATYYRPPQKLTKQSIEGAVVGTETISVPAGTFTARKVVYGDGGGGSTEWYLVDRVPGGNARTVHRGAGGDSGKTSSNYYQMDLTAYGSGATSELGIKP